MTVCFLKPGHVFFPQSDEGGSEVDLKTSGEMGIWHLGSFRNVTFLLVKVHFFTVPSQADSNLYVSVAQVTEN